MTWVTINLPWRISLSPEMRALNDEFIAAVKASGDAWANQFPDLHKLEIQEADAYDEAFASQDKHPWITGHLKAENIHAWHEESLKRVSEVPLCIQYAYRNLVGHRYAYVLKSNYTNTCAEVTDLQRQIGELRKREYDQQFCSHSACQVGVQIDIRSGNDRRILLIGDLTPSGLDDGCCSSGLKDEDVIVRYRDLRPFFKDE